MENSWMTSGYDRMTGLIGIGVGSEMIRRGDSQTEGVTPHRWRSVNLNFLSCFKFFLFIINNKNAIHQSRPVLTTQYTKDRVARVGCPEDYGDD
jgi:hypothetical protein